MKKIIVAFLLAAMVLTGCGGGSDSELVVLEWSGYETESYWAPFTEAHPEVKPAFSFFADDAEALAKTQSGFSFDVVHPCSSWWGLYVEMGLVLPLDTSRIPNFDLLYPELAAMGQFDGEQYFIPYDWGYESILVRTDLVEDVPDSWADLWDPQYQGHVSIFDSAEVGFMVAAVVLGIDPYNPSEADIEAIKALLVDLKPNLLKYWTDYTEINQLVAQGDVWLASNTWNDAFAVLYEEGYEVEYIVPEEGRLGWVCGYGISAESDDLDLAYDYLNALIDPEAISAMGNDFYYGVASEAGTALLDETIVGLMGIGDPEILSSTIFYQSLTEEQRMMREALWTEVKAGQ